MADSLDDGIGTCLASVAVRQIADDRFVKKQSLADARGKDRLVV